MQRRDNYAIQAAQAKQLFLQYDQDQLIKKLGLIFDEGYLYVDFFGMPYRIARRTGDISFLEDGVWRDGNSFNQVLTLFDLICGCKKNRCLTGRYKSIESFGMQFHRDLTERKDPTAQFFDAHIDIFRQVCQDMGGQKLAQGDAGYTLELFDGLRIAVILWSGDEEFPPRLKYLFDENALLYIRYETMYYVVNHLISLLKERVLKYTKK